jgi:hypothetical protein
VTDRFEDGLSATAYHATPALSKSGVGILVDECPAKFWWQSPLNPAYEPERKKEFDIGTAAHLIFLEPDLFTQQTVIVEGFTKEGKPSAGYATDDAKNQRAAAYAACKTPLLKPELAKLEAMRAALMQHPLAKDAFQDGIAERSHFWTDPEFDIPCKARPDWHSIKRGYMVDYKTTSSAHPRDFSRKVWEHHYFVQQPWYLDGVKQTMDETPRFLFIVQETEAPYLVSVFELELSTAEWGRKYASKGKQIYARCLERGEWPGYRDPAHPDQDRMMQVELPSYAQSQLIDRDERDEFFTGTKDRRFATRSARIIHEANAIGAEQ